MLRSGVSLAAKPPTYTPPNGYFPVGPWVGLAVLAAYAAVALGAAEGAVAGK